MISPNGPWWDFEECGWCNKSAVAAVLYRMGEADKTWSSVWFVCADCMFDAPALIAQHSSAQWLRIEPVWLWSHSPRLESGPGPGHSWHTLLDLERKWVGFLDSGDHMATVGWRVVREGWRQGGSRLS